MKKRQSYKEHRSQLKRWLRGHARFVSRSMLELREEGLRRVARRLKDEGYYSVNTPLCDIERTLRTLLAEKGIV